MWESNPQSIVPRLSDPDLTGPSESLLCRKKKRMQEDGISDDLVICWWSRASSTCLSPRSLLEMQALQPAPDLWPDSAFLVQSPGTWCAHSSLMSSPDLQLGLEAVLPPFLLMGVPSWALAVSQLREVRLTQTWGLVQQTLPLRPPPGCNTVSIPCSRQDSLPFGIFLSPHLVTISDSEGKKKIHPP